MPQQKLTNNFNDKACDDFASGGNLVWMLNQLPKDTRDQRFANRGSYALVVLLSELQELNLSPIVKDSNGRAIPSQAGPHGNDLYEKSLDDNNVSMPAGSRARYISIEKNGTRHDFAIRYKHGQTLSANISRFFAPDNECPAIMIEGTDGQTHTFQTERKKIMGMSYLSVGNLAAFMESEIDKKGPRAKNNAAPALS